MMAHKNQELFSIMYSEKIYREHCTALSSLNTTLYREPPTPLVQPVQPKSPNTITIQPTPPIKKQKMQSQSQSQSPQQQQPQSNKPIKLPPTTVITPAPPQPIQQHHLPQQPQHNSQQQVRSSIHLFCQNKKCTIIAHFIHYFHFLFSPPNFSR